jgi:hypothetical protein
MYTLSEVAERWQKTENDILRMAIDGKIVLSAWWLGGLLINVGVGIESGRVFHPVTRLHKGLFAIRRRTIWEFLACGESLKVHFFENGGQHLYFSDYVLDERVPLELTRKKIFIDSTHLADAEANHPELVAGVADNLQKDLPLLEGMKDETPDTISKTWQEIESKSGMTRNTFQEWAEKAGVQWKDEEDELRITLKDILKVKSFRDKTKKEQKKK